MKTICISKSKFEKVLGYSFWGFVTIVMITFLVLNAVEINTWYEAERQLNWFGGKSHAYCYKTILTNEELCSDSKSSFRQIIFWIGNIINFIVIGFWVYHKQQKFRFSWCLNDGSES